MRRLIRRAPCESFASEKFFSCANVLAMRKEDMAQHGKRQRTVILQPPHNFAGLDANNVT
jgi:hypothetical protein